MDWHRQGETPHEIVGEVGQATCTSIHRIRWKILPRTRWKPGPSRGAPARLRGSNDRPVAAVSTTSVKSFSGRRDRLGEDATKITSKTPTLSIVTLKDRLRPGDSTARAPVLIPNNRQETRRYFIAMTSLGLKHGITTRARRTGLNLANVTHVVCLPPSVRDPFSDRPPTSRTPLPPADSTGPEPTFTRRRGRSRGFMQTTDLTNQSRRRRDTRNNRRRRLNGRRRDVSAGGNPRRNIHFRSIDGPWSRQ